MQGTLSRRNTAGREKEEASVACHYLCEGNISSGSKHKGGEWQNPYLQVATPAAFFARTQKLKPIWSWTMPLLN